MPIDLAKFHLAQKALEERILEVLARDPKKAYSIVDIIGACEGYDNNFSVALLLMAERSGGQRSPTWDKYLAALTKLISVGKLAQADFQGSPYFALKGGT